MEDINTAVGIFIAFATISGCFFKIWIINPLSLAIHSVEANIGKVVTALEKIREQSVTWQTDIAEVRASTESAHKRLDDFATRLSKLESREH